MNILFIVFSLLMFLTIATYREISRFNVMYQSHREYLSLHHSDLKRKNDSVKRRFYDLKRKRNSPHKGKKQIALHLLAEGDTGLQASFIHLLKMVYGEELFYIEAAQSTLNFERDLLKSICEFSKDNKDVKKVEDLGKLVLANPLMQQALYKMLKGGEGYLPLKAFISLGSHKVVSLSKAQPELLSALLGSALSEQVQNLKNTYKQKKYELSEEEEEALNKEFSKRLKELSHNFPLSPGLFSYEL